MLPQKSPCEQCSDFSGTTKHVSETSSPAKSLLELSAPKVEPVNDFVCKKCSLRFRERRETIQEIAETEKRYGRDLMVLKEVS